MDRVPRKVSVFVLCCALMVAAGISPPAVVGMLVAVSLSALFELPTLSQRVRIFGLVLYCVLAVFIPSYILFLPLIAGDLFSLRSLWLRFFWLIPLSVVFLEPQRIAQETLSLSGAAVLLLLSCTLTWRETRISIEREALRVERDILAQQSYNLALRNRDLEERQELELRLATLNERSRIAREIHDNVGHLLTRSVLQVKALGVIHAQDEMLARELEEVGDTLDTAFETVRTSVHDLHEESHSFETQLHALKLANEGIEVCVEYRAKGLPTSVAHSFIAIAREALSNTERHSDATQVRILVVEFSNIYQLMVHDNGRKSPVQGSAKPRSGIGLSSMEERTRALGGIFRTSYENGFKVFVSVPKEEGQSS